MNDKIFVEINGMKQGMFLQSENIQNPLLLFLHGGPGSPEIAFAQKYPTGLEKIFTVCWWEQRGSGISYSHRIHAHEMTISQMISDTIAIVHYLKKRFKKEKVYVMGHSWGSLLGILTVQQAPHLFYAYIGVGQVAQQLESERMAYSFMLDEFKKNNDIKMLRKFEKYPIGEGGEVSLPYLNVRSQGMTKLGMGFMHHSTSMTQFVFAIFFYSKYTLREKFNFPKGNDFSLENLWPSILQINLIRMVPELKIPVYIFQGKYDIQASYIIAKKFAMNVIAPIKGFYTFENSAHSPCFEEPEKMCTILLTDVLQRKVNLSDILEKTDQNQHI